VAVREYRGVGARDSNGMTGCTAVRVKLGARVHIDKLPVTTIEASLLNGPAIRPGQNSPMVVTFTDATGKVWVTEGAGQGKILWSDLTVSASVVTVNKKGVLSLPHDPRKSDGKTGQVEISVPSHPELHASLTVPVSYSFPFAASFSGASGMSGTNGTDGSDGMSDRAVRWDRAFQTALLREETEARHGRKRRRQGR